MSSEVDFSPSDWAALRDLPFTVILGAIVADEKGAGWQVGRETAVAAHQLIADAKDRLDNPLIVRVLEEMSKEGTDSGDREVDLDDEVARSSAVNSALAASAAAAAVLSRADSGQAQAYKQWVYDAAVAAASATKSGGVLGIGDQQISDSEAEFLNNLAINLGLIAGADESI